MSETLNRQQGGWIAAGALHGLIALAMEAFAAHGLEGRVSPEGLEWIDTGAHLEMFHGLTLIAVASLRAAGALGLWARAVRWGFFFGAGLFAGSLYVRAFTGWTAIAVLTPIGGALLILSWIGLLMFGARLWWWRA